MRHASLADGMKRSRRFPKRMKHNEMIGVTYTIRWPLHAISFEKIGREILGARYSLSLVVCGDHLARRINHAFRAPARDLSARLPERNRSQSGNARTGKKNYSPNVLSFALGRHEGEIFLNARKAEREIIKLGIPVRKRVAYLFVHGCLHLKGYRHGQRMEKLEQKFLKKFGF